MKTLQNQNHNQDEVMQNMHITFRWVYIQSIAILLIAILLGMIFDIALACSVLLGAMVHSLPNIVFVSCVFKKSSNPTPSLILRWFYFGEMCKIILTIVLFALCFIWAEALSLNVIVLFCSYVAVLCINLLGVMLLESNSKSVYTRFIAGV